MCYTPKETQEAKQSGSGYLGALSRLYDSTEAFADSEPYLISLVARGSAFLYQGGFLSYLSKDEIRILNTHDASREEQVLDVSHVTCVSYPIITERTARECC